MHGRRAGSQRSEDEWLSVLPGAQLDRHWIDPDLAPDRWTIRTILDRVGALGDPMAPARAGGQRLPPFE